MIKDSNGGSHDRPALSERVVQPIDAVKSAVRSVRDLQAISINQSPPVTTHKSVTNARNV